MGRGRIPMELIPKEKARKITFLKRKKGLLKKVYEFSTLCGVDVCVIIYSPNFDGDDQENLEPETWPPDIDEVNRIIQKYNDTTSDRRPKIYDVLEYYKDRIQKVEGEISKLHKEKLKIMYPTWDESFNDMRDEQLRMFISILDSKIDACNQRINFLKQLDSKGKKVIVESSQKKVEAIIDPPPISSGYVNFMHHMSHQEGQLLFPPPIMNPISDINNSQPQLPFYPFQFGESSSSSHSNSMLQFDQNCMELLGKNNGLMINWGDNQVDFFNYHDAKNDHMVKDNNRPHQQSNQNSLLPSSYYYGNMQQSIQPYTFDSHNQQDPHHQYQATTSLQNLLDVPPGLQINGLYDENLLQAHQMLNYMLGRK